MNWIDLAIIALVAMAAIRGAFKGFVREICALAGLVLGVWAGLHLSEQVVEMLGMPPQNGAVSFLITLVAIVVILHLVGLLLTKVIDAAELGMPNRIAGGLLASLRKAFLISVVLNVLSAGHAGLWSPSAEAREASVLFAPVRAFAPMFIPALSETKWVKQGIDRIEQRLQDGAE